MIIPVGLKLRHIRAFLTVAEHQSVSAAARHLNVSQPALSKTIADTEHLLGQTLFDRSGRQMSLTLTGTLFRRHALNAVHSLESGIQEINGTATEETISVGLLPTVAGSLFPDVARAFSEARPSAVISVTTGPHGYLLERLRNGAIDLMVGRMPEPGEMAGLRFEFLYEDPIDLVARKGHPKIGTDVPAAIRTNPVIMPTRDSIIRKIVDGFLKAQGLDMVRAHLETVSLNLALPLLVNSDMIWFISRGVVARELASGTLETFDLGAGYMSGAVGITLRSAAESKDAADLLVELLHVKAAERAEVAT